jgi:hypothetical protein
MPRKRGQSKKKKAKQKKIYTKKNSKVMKKDINSLT